MKRFRNFENISHKENDFIQIEYGSVYKILVRLFIKGAELNPYKMAEKNIESLEECWKKKIF